MFDAKDLPANLQVEAVKYWQKREELHPLTCVESSHGDLIPFVKTSENKVYLRCLECGYTQGHIPDSIFQLYLRNNPVVTKVSFYKYEVFQAPKKEDLVNGAQTKPYGIIVALGPNLLPTTGDPSFFNIQTSNQVSRGIIFDGDIVVYSDDGQKIVLEGVYGPSEFERVFTKYEK